MSEWSLRPDLPSATFDVDEECPHCDDPQPSRQMDTHVATAHADLPPCTARIKAERCETYRCAFRAGHAKGEYGLWHASTREASPGRHVWNDSAPGATPHRPSEPSDSLDKLKAAGVLSHTVVATGDGSPTRTCGEHDGPCFPDPAAKCSAHGEQQCARCHRNPSDCLTEDGACGRWSWSGMHWDTCPNRRRGPLTDADLAPQMPERPVKATCAVLHTDEQGNTIPCPHEQAKGDPNFTLNEINGKWRWLCGNCNGYSRNFPTADEAQDDFNARHIPCPRAAAQDGTPVSQKPRASVIEIIASGRKPTEDGGGSIIVPNEVRINGVSVFTTGNGVKINEFTLGDEAVSVTLTLVVRKLTIDAASDLATSGSGGMSIVQAAVRDLPPPYRWNGPGPDEEAP